MQKKTEADTDTGNHHDVSGNMVIHTMISIKYIDLLCICVGCFMVGAGSIMVMVNIIEGMEWTNETFAIFIGIMMVGMGALSSTNTYGKRKP